MLTPAHARRGPPLPARPLHAPRARSAHAPVADGEAARAARPVPRDRRARSDEHRHGDTRRSVAAERDRRLPDRSRSNPPEAEEVDGAERLHPRRHERPAHPRRPLQGADGRAGAAAVRRGGAQLRGDRPGAARPVRERARRSAARARGRRPRVRPGRSRRPRDHRSEPRRRGRGGRRHAGGARVRPLHAAGGGARGRAADGAHRPQRPPHRHRLPRHDEGSPGGDRRRGGARARVRARSRPRRASVSRTRSSISSRPDRRRVRTACGCSAACSSPRRC